MCDDTYLRKRPSKKVKRKCGKKDKYKVSRDKQKLREKMRWSKIQSRFDFIMEIDDDDKTDQEIYQELEQMYREEEEMLILEIAKMNQKGSQFCCLNCLY